ncbi:phage tail length tape measure family protein [Pararoseomonas sp. SCSIO 73927]|uniref:phage tail length tape measure family protein n=1 Tax=Pararoseomonas sp. SCSIO 73927 TaxID=3114537 RepID=UPI0030CC02BD
MSGSRTYAFRLEADAAPLEAAYGRATRATDTFQSATEAFSAAMARTGAPIDAFTASLAKISGGTSSAERATRSAATSFSNLVASLDPVTAAYQKAARAEAAMTDLQVRGIAISDRERQVIGGLWSEYEHLAASMGAAGEAARRSVAAREASTAAAVREREAEAALGAELDRMQARLNPLIGLNQRYRASLEEIGTLQRAGRLTSQQAAEAVDRETAAYDRAREAISGRVSVDEQARRAAAQTASETERAVAALNGYVRALDPLAASLARVTQAEEDLAQAQRQGVATPAQVAAVTQMRRGHDELAAASNRAGGAIKLQAHEITNLSAQAQGWLVQVMSGGGLFLPTIQQAPQAVGAVGGVSRALELLRQTFTPTRVAALAFAAGGVAVTAAAISQANELARLDTQLKGIEGTYSRTAAAVKASAESVARSAIGVSGSEARAAQVSLASSAAGARIGGLDYGELTKQTADLAARLGIDLAAALDKVGGAMRNPVALVDELRARGFPGMTESLRLTVQRLVEAGDQGTAFALVMGRVGETSRDAAKEGGPLQQALRELKSSFGTIWDDIKDGLANAGTPLLSWMAGVIKEAQRIRDLNLGKGAGDQPGDLPFGRTPSGRPRSAIEEIFGLNRADAGAPGAATATSGRVPADYRPSVDRGADVAGVDRELMYRIFALGERSRRGADGNWLVSPVGARGGMQVMPGTFAEMASRYGIRGGIDNDDANAEAGARYMRELLDRFGGNVPRAAAAYNAGPNRPEATLRAIEQGAYARRVTDGYTGPGTVSIRVPEVRVEADRITMRPDFDRNMGDNARQPAMVGGNAYELALGIARGAPGSPQVSGGTDEARGRSAAGLIRNLQEGLRAAAGTDQPVDSIVQKIRELNQVVDKGQGTQALFLRGLREQSEAAAILDPRLKATAEALAQYRDRMRSAGEAETDEGRKAAVAAALANLGVAYKAAEQEVGRNIAAQGRLSVAWGEGRDAVIRLTAEERAREVVRQAGYAGTTEEDARVRKLTDAYLLLAQQQAENNQRAQNQGARDNLALLEKERDLIGATADERERELAAFRARQQALASGVKDEGLLRETQDLARAQVDATRRNQLLTNSATALRDIWSETGDVIRTSIVGGLASGEAKAISFGNVMRAIQAQFLGKAFEFTISNPLLNQQDGGTRASIWSAPGTQATLNRIGGWFSGGGNTSGSAPATPGSSGFSMGDVSSWGSGISKLWDAGKNLFRGGSTSLAATDPLGTGVIGTGEAVGSVAPAATGGMDFSGVGMGIAIGSFAGGLIAGAKNPARQQNSQIGSTVGAIVGAYFGPIGSMVGGALGGAIGGLFGPKGAFTGGYASFGVQGGQFTTTNVNGKRVDGAQLQNAADEQVAEVNRAMKRVGVTLGGLDMPLAAIQGFGDAAGRSAEPDFVRQIRSRVVTGSAVVDNVTRASKADNLEDLFADVQWGRDVYEPLTKTGVAASEFQVALASSLKTVDEAIKKARELGLAEDVLQQKRKEASDAAYAARDRELQSTTLDLEARRKQAEGTYGTSDQLRRFDVAAGEELRLRAERLKGLGLEPEDGREFDLVRQTRAAQVAERIKLERDLARADEDKARARYNAGFNLDIDTLNSTGRGNTAARMVLQNQGETAILAMQRSLQDLGKSAQEVSDAVEKATGNLGIAAKRLEEDQRIALEGLNGGLVDRYQTAMGTADEEANQLARLERQHAAERIQIARQEGADLAQLERTQAAEREAITKAATERRKTEALAVGQSIRAFLDGLRTTSAAARSPQEQFQAASLFFERDVSLTRSGDADASGRITSTAQSLLEAASAMYGGTRQFAAVRDYVEATLASLPQTVAYDAQTVQLLRQANATSIAQQLQLDIIAQRAGGAEGAGIVRAAVDAGYGATIAALSSTSAHGWSVAEALSAAEILAGNGDAASITASLTVALTSIGSQTIANDNTRTASTLGVVNGLIAQTAAQVGTLGRIAARSDEAAGFLLGTNLNTGATTQAARDLNSTIAGGTNPLLSLIYDATVKVGQILSAGIDVRGDFGRTGPAGPSWEPGQGGDSGAGGDAGGAGGAGGGAGGSSFALGGVFDRGRVVPFARGGALVSTPTYFPMSEGRTGLMGEAGPEAIMPLGRDSAGRLGVRVSDAPLARGSTSASGGSGDALLAELRGLRSEVGGLRAEVRTLRDERGRDAAIAQGQRDDATRLAAATAGGVDGLRRDQRGTTMRARAAGNRAA